ncbi:hypothetical protein [Photobacterium damselae]|uniref:hypothetical protein n=1 Tax=Photobacterium damselae TaxID=38293 RepID=UPI000D085987|nr:hypothetical protein [Photobacterium damselae]PSB77902.1 hypothetical protein C5F62_19410 [Photobacterium damselae subsp. damselae]
MSKAKRLQFDISDSSFERLKKLKNDTGASSYGEVTNKAYKIYEFINTAINDDKQVIIRDKDGKEVFVEFL